jgi:hypothetical protein
MAKQIKQAITAAFVTFVAFTIMGPAGLALNLSVTAATAATVSFVTTLVASVIGKMTSKGINASAGNFGTKFATRAPLAPRQIVYGECRVGGTMVHMETTGTDNYLLHMVVAIAGHEIESLESLRLNDINTTTTTSTINGSTVYTVTNADFTNTENDNNFGSGRLVRYSFEDGSQTAVNGFMNAQLASMGTTDKFLGVAYVYIQMVFDAEKFGGGQPAISFKVKGKNVYDPRTSANATTDLQRSNPALIIRDYLTDTQYGLKAKASEINDTTNAGGIASAANTCDQNVTLADGVTTETRYTANGFTNFSANGNGVLESLLSSMAGKMSYVNGQFTVFAGASQTPSLTITDDQLLAPLAVSTNSSSGDLFNSVKPIYVDASLNYISTDAEVYQDSTFLNADTPSGESTANYVKQMETQLPFTVTDTMAQRLGRIALKSQRQSTTLSVLVSLEFMRLQPNDWVYLTNERLSYSQKTFEVLSTNMEVIQDGDVPIMATRLELKEVEASVFNFATNDYTTGQAEGSDVSTGDYSVTAPSNLSLAQQNAIDGTTSKVDILVSWTNNASDKVTLTEITYKLSTDSNYTSDFTAGKGVAKASIPNVVVGSTYNVKIRHIDVNGVASPYTSVVNITISAASSAPSAPSNLTSSTGKQSILISWTNPNNSDLRAVKVYRRTANTTPTDDTYLVDTLAGEPNAVTTTIFGDQDGLTAGTTYYFWVRAINHSGQHSSFVGSVNGTFTAAVIGDGTITTLKLAANAVTQAKIAVDAIQGSVIAAGAITEAKLGTDAVTAAKIADNAVTSAQIAADAVTTAKIADDAVTTALIANNAIGTAQIANDAVTNALIATDAVNQDSIAANSVTATQIVAGTITASEIASNAITTAKIAADAITTAKIAAGAITASEITSNAITTAKIAAGAITAAKIGAGEITATQIASDTITANQIASNAITTNELAANAVTAAKITANTITASEIAASAITATEIASNAVTTDKLNANAVTAAKITAGTITATEIASNTITGDRINVDTLNVKSFDNVSSTIVSHVTAGTKFPLAKDGQAYVQRTGTYTGSNAAFVPVTITEVRDNAGYVAIFSGVLGNVNGGRVQYSLDNSTWVNANGNTNIYWNAGTYRGYTYVYTGQITTLSASQSTVYWRVYFSGGYNHTQLSLNVMMDNTR